MPRNAALALALLYTVLAAGWLLLFMLNAGERHFLTWLYVAVVAVATANAVYYWVAYVRARRAQR
ncbi:hypothetical protein AB0F91_45670 [Amycolatopsis sp. NPDC023774]|uniref:hypothetical protein n=1 Tax=Amycolatopsis sp. NPDC023774 TaxID=3155015 RepID=UPI0033CB7CAA